MLREFYLRWSMKEAYTKAIGMGMHMDFHKFETRLCHIDNDEDDDDDNNNSQVDNTDDEKEEGVWTYIIRRILQQSKDDNRDRITMVDDKRNQLSVTGRVLRHSNPLSLSSSSSSSVWEEWEFIFVLLGNNDIMTVCETEEDDHRNDLACACICIGPSPKSKKKQNPSSGLSHNTTLERTQGCYINCFESLTLLDLIQLHGNILAGENISR